LLKGVLLLPEKNLEGPSINTFFFFAIENKQNNVPWKHGSQTATLGKKGLLSAIAGNSHIFFFFFFS